MASDPFASSIPEPQTTPGGAQPADEPTSATAPAPEDRLSIQNLRNEEAIQAALPGVCLVLDNSSMMTQAVFDILKYVPVNVDATPESKKLWRDTMQPKLTKALKDDLILRSHMDGPVVSGIRQLALGINQSAALVKASLVDGSMATQGRAIKIAQETIATAFSRLEAARDQLQSMGNAAVQLFTDNLKDVYEICGSSSVEGADTEIKLFQVKINTAEAERRTLERNYARCQGNVARINTLISATQMRIGSQEETIRDAKKRQALIAETIKDGDAALDNLPNMMVAATSTTKYLWGLYSRVAETRIKNEDMSAQRDYYSTLVKEREERLRQEAEYAGRSERFQEELAVRESSLRAELAEATKELQLAVKDLRTKVPVYDEIILTAKEGITTSRARVADAVSKFGVPGCVLLDALVAFRQIQHVGHQAVGIYAPIAALLDDVLMQVRPAIEMLSSGSQSQVILAGSELLKSVGFLLQLSTMLKRTLTASWTRNLHRAEISKQFTGVDMKALDYCLKDEKKW